jgi:Ca2+-binding EF-hand superfamily protein
MFSDTLAKNGGFITFADYAHALSNLLRGSIDDKIDFVFRLYDLNNDNVITLDELSRIFFAVYRLLGDNVNQKHDQMTYEQQAERLYNKIDLEQSGSITREQFINYCKRDSSIVDTIQMLEMSICSSA